MDPLYLESIGFYTRKNKHLTVENFNQETSERFKAHAKSILHHDPSVLMNNPSLFYTDPRDFWKRRMIYKDMLTNHNIDEGLLYTVGERNHLDYLARQLYSVHNISLYTTLDGTMFNFLPVYSDFSYLKY